MDPASLVVVDCCLLGPANHGVYSPCGLPAVEVAEECWSWAGEAAEFHRPFQQVAHPLVPSWVEAVVVAVHLNPWTWLELVAVLAVEEEAVGTVALPVYRPVSKIASADT